MNLSIKNLPLFAAKAARDVTEMKDQPLSSLTVGQAENIIKFWMYEALMEIKAPEELSVTYHTRSAASKKLAIAPATLDDIVNRHPDVSYRWIGNRKILLDGDLQKIIQEHNIYHDEN
jgi:hypothetical protein